MAVIQAVQQVWRHLYRSLHSALSGQAVCTDRYVLHLNLRSIMQWLVFTRRWPCRGRLGRIPSSLSCTLCITQPSLQSSLQAVRLKGYGLWPAHRHVLRSCATPAWHYRLVHIKCGCCAVQATWCCAPPPSRSRMPLQQG